MFFKILTPPRPYTNFPREVVSQIIGAGGPSYVPDVVRATRALIDRQASYGIYHCAEFWLEHVV
jgi:hypothetical protein